MPLYRRTWFQPPRPIWLPTLVRYTLDVDVGTLTLSGQTITFGLGTTVQNGTLALSGQSLPTTITMPVTEGTPEFEGQDLAFLLGLGAEAGLLTLEGQEIGLAASEPQSDEPEQQATGGYRTYLRYEQEMLQREDQKRRRKRLEEEAREIKDAVDREIAQLIHGQEARRDEEQELERLGALVAEFEAHRAELDFNERVTAALIRAAAQQNASALLAFDRELRRQMEEEEMAVLMALALDD